MGCLSQKQVSALAPVVATIQSRARWYVYVARVNTIQRMWRAHAAREAMRKRQQLALCIQCCWRRRRAVCEADRRRQVAADKSIDWLELEVCCSLNFSLSYL